MASHSFESARPCCVSDVYCPIERIVQGQRPQSWIRDFGRRKDIAPRFSSFPAITSDVFICAGPFLDIYVQYLLQRGVGILCLPSPCFHLPPSCSGFYKFPRARHTLENTSLRLFLINSVFLYPMHSFLLGQHQKAAALLDGPQWLPKLKPSPYWLSTLLPFFRPWCRSVWRQFPPFTVNMVRFSLTRL